ncbi:ABC transporter family protein [Enteractinococcus coprophilus]|uniref:ABC transporter family protein n=2 Tax=Enteractinococcus coprophilus TaxID=1027633 RepID=A0A542ZYN8_9MICC|nr:ABC transporter family protein [Enteractinococcus coprophilus]
MTSMQHSGLTVDITVAQRKVNVAFSVPHGEVLALVGPNGSGKTTTLMALAGWLMPDVGKAKLDGTVLFDCPDPTRKPHKWLPAHQRGIGYLSQDHHLFPHLSAVDNIMYGMDRADITGRRARRAKAEEWLDRIGLAGYGKRKPHQLSGGQAQRVAIARVLASGPRLVLLDEPLAALDVKAAPAIRNLLTEVLRDLTVILVTHHQDDIVALADEVYHIIPQR